MSRQNGTSGQQSYIASKYGIAGFAASLQLEVKSHGIRVCLLNVGMVNTELGTKPPKSGAIRLSTPESLIQQSDVASCVKHCLTLPKHISPTSYDLCQTSNEFLDNDGKGLKFSAL